MVDWYEPRGPTSAATSKVEHYKAISCLIYQCSEEGAYNDLLFLSLTELAHELAATIVAELPAYQAAPWDVDRSRTTGAELVQVCP